VAVEATLEVVEPPVVNRLYFWALQAGFSEGTRRTGAGHLGLQHHPRHPGGTAVNWGGYRAGGGLLDGSESALPSARNNPNTRDFDWRPRVAYRLSITPSPDRPGAWRGAVTDLATGGATVVRDLYGGGDRLIDPVVWSEVFADCDHPSAAVRWSALSAITAAGERLAPRAVRVGYQSHADGGCDNTTVEPDGSGFIQRTTSDRQVPPGAVVPWPT
jgi:hypothetical protein